MAKARIAPPEIRARRISRAIGITPSEQTGSSIPTSQACGSSRRAPRAEQPPRPLVAEQAAEDARHEQPHQDRRGGLYERLGDPEYHTPEDGFRHPSVLALVDG